METQYLDIVRNVLENGQRRQTRNGQVLSLFGSSLIFPLCSIVEPSLRFSL